MVVSWNVAQRMITFYAVYGFFCLQLAAERCSKSFSAAGRDREKELKLMLDWASEGFLPTGPVGFAPAGKFCSCWLQCIWKIFPALRELSLLWYPGMSWGSLSCRKMNCCPSQRFRALWGRFSYSWLDSQFLLLKIITTAWCRDTRLHCSNGVPVKRSTWVPPYTWLSHHSAQFPADQTISFLIGWEALGGPGRLPPSHHCTTQRFSSLHRRGGSDSHLPD